MTRRIFHVKLPVPLVAIGVSGLPDGIFLPRLLAYADARQGVMVTGYREPCAGLQSR